METAGKNWKEQIITGIIKAAGYSVIIFVGLIFFFLMKEGLPTLGEVPLSNLLSTRWYPIEDYYGLLPLISGSLLVTIGATAIAVPFGIGGAVYISEIAPPSIREILKPLVEVLGGLPSVVLGFLGMVILTALAGAILLGGIAIPTVVSVSEDALDAVPKSYRDAALALGATEWQTIWRVTLPAARSGVLTAVMLGIGRAIGETMTVMMVTGNAPIMFKGLISLFLPTRTMNCCRNG